MLQLYTAWEFRKQKTASALQCWLVFFGAKQNGLASVNWLVVC